MKHFLAPIFLLYLRFLAIIQISKINPKIVGIGGSSGKTSTAHLIDTILSKHFKVRPSKGKNSETGIPLTILGIEANTYRIHDWASVCIKAFLKILTDFNKFDVLVAEMGIDGPKEPKNMAYLLKIIKPDISILTNVGLEHSAYFDDTVSDENPISRKEKIMDILRKDETKILTQISKDSYAILNLDDPSIEETIPNVKAHKITISSKNSSSDYLIRDYQVSLKRTEIAFIKKGKNYRIIIPSPLPYFYSYSIVYSIACANILGIDVNDAIGILESDFSLPQGRLSVFDGIRKTTIIDSSYNNSIEAISGVLDFADLISEKRRKFGIIGDIREQGKQSEDIHKQLAKKISQTLDFAILIGEENAKITSEELKKIGFDFKSFITFSDAKKAILNQVREGDLIIVKGSQNKLLLERAVELLLKNRKDSEKLTRRGKFWDKVRSVTP